LCDVLQDDNGKSDSTADRAEKDEKPVKIPRVGTDVQPTEDLHPASINADVSSASTGGENTPFVVDLTTSNDSELSPRSPAVDGRLSVSNDLPVCLPKSHELRLTENNCTCPKQQQLCSENCTISPPASPELRGDNMDRITEQQSVNGVCDASLLKTQYQSATVTGCHDNVTDEPADDRRDELAIQTNGFPSLESSVAGYVVNGGSIVHDCSL